MIGHDYPDVDPLPPEDQLDYDTAFAMDVAKEKRRIQVRDAAHAAVLAERGANAPGFDLGLLSEVLARPQEPPQRVEGLIPSDASTLIVAQRKTGKTTLMLNLARTLTKGEHFLGQFATRPTTGRVAILNYEVSGHQLARWADEVNVPQDRLLLVNLRGRRNPLPHVEDRARLAAVLREHEVESLIVDPFGRAYTGKSQNDPGEVGGWLTDLDAFARAEAGVSDLVLAAHAGWEGERTRGSSALEDWADVIITMVRDKDDQSARFLRAEGRDVLLDEDRLEFEPTTRLLSLSGAGSRRTATKMRRVDALVGFVVDELQIENGLSGYEIEKRWKAKGLSCQKGDGSAAAKRAVELGQVTDGPGDRGGRKYYLSADNPNDPTTSPVGPSDDHPNHPLRGVVRGAVDQVTTPHLGEVTR
ncbi:AAA family ATPase [Nocardioides massiliensis]|uniref:AAA domain-containing protein n=1 Tax=Nocardioides massiliensis TaxID=1325935 RepID=A0ABT9NQR7_9ACTN|nr:AAA family ATPase [Nocardioides massiliensis]MDP9822776.1 hypothetical protein [Nocardioides massiliensis]